MSTGTITKIRLPALDHVPQGVPSDIQMAIAHPDGFPMIADTSGIPIRAVGHFLRLECASPKTALAYRDDIYEFMVGIDAQGRRWNDPALIDDDFRAYRNMLCATPGATGRKRSVMIPLGIRLLTTASQTLDYVYGGMALATGIPLLILGVLGAIGHLLKGQNRTAPATTKP